MSGAYNENELVRFDSQNQQNNSVDSDPKQHDDGCFCWRMFKWFFEPVFPKFGYSFGTWCFHVINFAIALAAFIFVVTGLSVSVALVVVLCSGVPLYYICCEITLVIARIDLWITFKMVENDEALLKKRSANLQIPLVQQMPSCSLCWKRCCCPCTEDAPKVEANVQTEVAVVPNQPRLTCCNILFKRIKTFFTSCRMLVIYLYFLIIKPIITILTCWTFFIVVYAAYLLVIPFWYMIDDDTFKAGKVCPFGYTSCNNENGCKCNGLPVDNYNVVLLCFVAGVLSFPLALRLNNFSAYVSKTVTYYCLTQYYKYGIGDQDKDQQQLLYENNV